MRSPFKVIDGTPEPDGPRKRMKAAVEPSPVVRCPSCTGLAMIEVKLGMIRRHGKITGGQKQVICATCLSQGRTVIVT